MGLQIPRRLYSQVPQKNDLWRIAPASWGGVSQAGATEREPDRGGSSSCGSRAYVDFDSAEICGVAGGWLHQGEECDPFGSGLWRKEAQLRRSALLGEGLLCLHRRTGPRTDKGIHQETGSRGHAFGAVEPVAMSCRLQAAPANRGRVSAPCTAFSGPLLQRGRVSDPTAASSGSSIKAPGSAGGYLLSRLAWRSRTPWPLARPRVDHSTAP